MNKTPLSIYIHIPFCKAKCGYCDFLSFAGCEHKINEYADALCKDIAWSAQKFAGYSVVTVFFGGGTPSLMPHAAFEKILNALYKNFNIAQNCYFSTEANPDAVDIASLKSLGFNRISFGVQTFNDAHLKSIGRIHTAQKAKEVVAQAHELGFKDINIDLMFALPNQMLNDFDKSLQTALELPITHISCYALTIEENTPMQDFVTDENIDRKMYHLAKKRLDDAGFKHYEVSNWAKPGYECAHNTGYWTGQEYLGLGLGASSYFNNERANKTTELDEYLKGNFDFILQEKIDHIGRMGEFMFLGLRQIDGISSTEFLSRFGQSVQSVFANEIGQLLADGLIEQKDDKIRLTQRGLDIANVVFAEFLI